MSRRVGCNDSLPHRGDREFGSTLKFFAKRGSRRIVTRSWFVPWPRMTLAKWKTISNLFRGACGSLLVPWPRAILENNGRGQRVSRHSVGSKCCSNITVSLKTAIRINSGAAKFSRKQHCDVNRLARLCMQGWRFVSSPSIATFLAATLALVLLSPKVH